MKIKVPKSTNGKVIKNGFANFADFANGFSKIIDPQVTPTVPVSVYENLPNSLRNLCDLIEQEHQKNVFLVSSLPVIASHLINVWAPHKDKYYTPDLFTLIVAEPTSGKGIALKAKRLGNILDQHIYEQSKHEIISWENLPDEERNKTEKPKEKSLFIPANSSASAFHDSLQDNKERGLLFESEIDTLVNTSKQEWGNFSEVCRKAFHHESASINRKSGSFTINRPCLSICMTGTMDQFTRLFRNAENGLYSRYAFYTFNSPLEWQDHRPTKKSNKFNKLIDETSQWLFELYKSLFERTDNPKMKNTKSLLINLKDGQWNMINDTFSEMMYRIDDNGLPRLLQQTNKRMALVALRIITIVSVLRRFENKPEDLNRVNKISPTLSDMIVGIHLALIFVHHSIHLYNYLPSIKDSKGIRFDNLYSALPNKFKRKEVLKIARNLGIQETRSIDRWLKNEKKLIREKHGTYRKRK